MAPNVQPAFPIYIPSKSRSEIASTPQFLDRIGVPYRIIVEEQQRGDYERYYPASKLLTLDPAYQRQYETCDEYGAEKSLGSGPARNFAWEHSIAAGWDWHWIIDDNIFYFARLHQNERIPVFDGTPLVAMEDFVGRYRNVGMAGPNYVMFAKARAKIPPFVLNTRIYSCNLIRNDLPLRWRCRYNEDVDLSIRILKAGWVTVQFNAFLQLKAVTQTMPGGNTEAFYADEGTLEKSKMIVRLHPDVARLVWKFSRWHHHVDYRPFANNRLIRRPDYVPPAENPYHLIKVDVPAGTKLRRVGRAP